MKYHQKDSNFHLTDFKSVASACWAMVASTPGRIRTFSILLLRQARLLFHHGSNSGEERSRTLTFPVRSRAICPVNLLLQNPRGGAQTPFHLLRGYFPSSGKLDSNQRTPASKAGENGQTSPLPDIKQKTLLLAGFASLTKIYAQPTTIMSLPNLFGKGRSSRCAVEIIAQI